MCMSVIYSYLTTSEIITKIRLLSKREYRIVTNSKIVNEGKVFKFDINKFRNPQKRLALVSKYVDGIVFYQSNKVLLQMEKDIVLNSIMQLPA